MADDALTPERLAELRRLAEAAKEHLATGHRHSVAPIVALMDANGPDVVLALLDRLEAAEAALTKARADEYRCAHCHGQLLCMRCD